MAKKNTLGKVLAVAVAVAAVGGACYAYRDKIKESELYKKSINKLQSLRASLCKSCDTEDFDDEDEDTFSDGDFESIFSDDAKLSREYTSINITPSTAMDDEPVEEFEEDATEEESNLSEEPVDEAEETTASEEIDAASFTDSADDVTEEDFNEETVTDITEDIAEDVTEIFPDDSIPTISFASPEPSISEVAEEVPSIEETPEVLGYENEGLSDVYEDPDSLEDQDRLDY